jgi:hypothetical protein
VPKGNGPGGAATPRDRPTETERTVDAQSIPMLANASVAEYIYVRDPCGSIGGLGEAIVPVGRRFGVATAMMPKKFVCCFLPYMYFLAHQNAY